MTLISFFGYSPTNPTDSHQVFQGPTVLPSTTTRLRTRLRRTSVHEKEARGSGTTGFPQPPSFLLSTLLYNSRRPDEKRVLEVPDRQERARDTHTKNLAALRFHFHPPCVGFSQDSIGRLTPRQADNNILFIHLCFVSVC